MRTTLLVTVIAGATLLSPGLLERPAEAGAYWSVGSVFSVGGLDFAFVLGRPFGFQGDVYVYRTYRPLRYRGYACHGSCVHRGGYYYHHPNCSVVRHHFRRHSFYPERYFAFQPRYFGGHGHYKRHRHDHRSCRYDRHRYDRHRSDRHYYDRHRSDRHYYDRHRSDRHYYDRHRSDRHRYDHRRQEDRYRDGRHGADRTRSHRYRSPDRYERDRPRGDRERLYQRDKKDKRGSYGVGRHEDDRRRGRGWKKRD